MCNHKRVWVNIYIFKQLQNLYIMCLGDLSGSTLIWNTEKWEIYQPDVTNLAHTESTDWLGTPKGNISQIIWSPQETLVIGFLHIIKRWVKNKHHIQHAVKFLNTYIKVETEVLIYPWQSLLAEFGGALGLFLGFSFMTIWDFVVELKSFKFLPQI